MKSINTKKIVRLLGWWAPALALTLASPNAWSASHYLHLNKTGNGTVGPPSATTVSGMLVPVAAHRIVTATALSGNVFEKWTDDNNSDALVSPNAIYSFNMPDFDVAWTAHFIPNPFPAESGWYNGLFIDRTGVKHETSGFIRVNVAPSTTKPPTFSGHLCLNGYMVSFGSRFDVDGNWTSPSPITWAGGNPLTVHLHMDITGPPYDITGTVSDGAFISDVEADRATRNTGPPQVATKYVMVLPGAAFVDVATKPSGYSGATVTITSGGVAGTYNNRVNCPLKLADGTSASVFNPTYISTAHNRWPLYARAYGNSPGRGSVMGWVSGPPLSGTLLWTKTAGAPAEASYPAGFTINNDIMYDVLSPPPSIPDVPLYTLITPDISYTYHRPKICEWIAGVCECSTDSLPVRANIFEDIARLHVTFNLQRPTPNPDECELVVRVRCYGLKRSLLMLNAPQGGLKGFRYLYDPDLGADEDLDGGTIEQVCHESIDWQTPRPETRELLWGWYLQSSSTGYGYFIHNNLSYPFTFHK